MTGVYSWRGGTQGAILDSKFHSVVLNHLKRRIVVFLHYSLKSRYINQNKTQMRCVCARARRVYPNPAEELLSSAGP